MKKQVMPGGTPALNSEPPIGYNPISLIRGAIFHWLPVPFQNVQVWCKLKCLNGVFLTHIAPRITSLTIEQKEKSEPSLEDLIAIRNEQEELCKASMINPTFDGIFNMVTGEDFRIEEKRKTIAEIQKLLDSDKKIALSERQKLLDEIKKIEYEIGFILPDDTMNFISSWALGIDVTDIKKVTREILLDAAILANNGGKAPTDYIFGVFTDKQKPELDRAAWIVFYEYQEDKAREKKLTGKCVVRGNREPKKRK